VGVLMSLTRADRDRLIQQYADGPARLRAAFAAVPADARQWRPEPGEWSAHEVVVHCADSETQSASRIRVLVSDKDPVIQGYDEAQWAREFDYHAHPLDVALVTVDAVRANTTALLRRLPESAWAKVGRHTESGRYTAEDWLTIYADHLENHARQIEANVAAWNASAKG
jgi:DinB family protein